MMPSPFSGPSPIPFYPEYGLYFLDGPTIRQWEFNGWKKESLSWKQTCYIHAGLSMPGQIIYKGPDAERFLSEIFVNGFQNFRVGSAKHGIACDENGLVAGHGVIQRLAADEFCVFVAGTWTMYRHSITQYDVEQIFLDRFLFQIAGPTALSTLEAASGEDLRDIKFLGFRDVTIAGHRIQIMRLGMAGTLAYELHGPMSAGPEVYDAVFRAGGGFGIERLGWQTFPVNHVEGGYPQQFWTFQPSVYDHEGYQSFAANVPYLRNFPQFVGSVDPADHRARYRTPLECAWEKSIKLDHDFTGRAALERELAAPRRTVVTLEWNADDVVDIYASLFRPGEEYKYLEIPQSPANRRSYAHADHVRIGNRDVGISSGTIYSYYFRRFISMGVLDIGEAQVGNEVTILWGDFGERIKEVRAKVARFPYLAEGRNRDLDVGTLFRSA